MALVPSQDRPPTLIRGVKWNWFYSPGPVLGRKNGWRVAHHTLFSLPTPSLWHTCRRKVRDDHRCSPMIWWSPPTDPGCCVIHSHDSAVITVLDSPRTCQCLPRVSRGSITDSNSHHPCPWQKPGDKSQDGTYKNSYFAAKGRHRSMWPGTTAFDKSQRGYLRPEATPVCCGLMLQHSKIIQLKILVASTGSRWLIIPIKTMYGKYTFVPENALHIWRKLHDLHWESYKVQVDCINIKWGLNQSLNHDLHWESYKVQVDCINIKWGLNQSLNNDLHKVQVDCINIKGGLNQCKKK